MSPRSAKLRRPKHMTGTPGAKLALSLDKELLTKPQSDAPTACMDVIDTSHHLCSVVVPMS